jgi:mono/diheme cytochrome c family protein
MRFARTFAFHRVALLGLICAFASTANAQLVARNWLAVSHQLAPSGPGGSTGAIDFTPHGTQPGLIYDIQPPEPQCSACHSIAGGDPDTSPEFRPFSTWAGSMMANATRDPLFFAALDIANNDVPGVGDYCLRCHTPRGWLMGHVVKPGFGAPNDPVKGAAACLLNGTYDAPDDLNSDMGGVTCHFCHRLMPTGPNGEPGYTENGNAWVDDVQCANTGGGPPCRRGPYAYDDGTAPPPHEWEFSQYHTESQICGVCHNVSSPDISRLPPATDRIFGDGFDGSAALKTLKLDDGTDTGHPMPIERTFAEWQQSQYAEAPQTTCQSCHMPESEDPEATACSYRINNRTGNLPVHAFVGGNTWVPGIIKGEFGAGLDQSGTNRTQSLQQTIDWSRELLGTAAALDTTIQSYTPPTSTAPGAMALSIRVTNLTGHKLPTGYSEGRRMWLNVQVRDANGGLVFESAAYDATTAELTQDPQAHVYEVLQGIWNYHGTGTCDIENASNEKMFHFVLNDCIARDSRIPPLGFTPATAADPNGYDLRPVGYTYAETSPGSGVLVNYDTATYTLAVPPGTVTPLTATARLYYQTASNYYIEFLRDEALNGGFPAENDMCSAGPNRPFTVGPQARTRGEYMYELWNNAPDDTTQPGYGKSPPELMQTSAASTSTR